jgi:hypothetical protein
MRARGVPEDRLAAVEEELVALAAYHSDPDRYDTRAAAGDADARAVVRGAAAAYQVTDIQAGRWIRPLARVTDAQRAFADAVAALPAPAAGEPETWVVEVPGQPVPGFAVDHVRGLLAGMPAGQAAETRVVFAGGLSEELLHSAGRELTGFGVKVFHLADQDAALADPAAALAGADQWEPVPAAADPAPGSAGHQAPPDGVLAALEVVRGGDRGGGGGGGVDRGGAAGAGDR